MNPKLDIENTPFFVNAAQRPGCVARPAPGRRQFVRPRRNQRPRGARRVLPAPTGPPARRQQLLVLSGPGSGEALDRAALQLRDHLVQDVTVDLADVAFTLQTGRRRFARRRSIVSPRSRRRDHISRRRRRHPVRDCTGEADGPWRRVHVPRPGLQHVNMARRLYETEPVFRDVIDGCAEVLQPEIGVDLRTVLYPGESD